MRNFSVRRPGWLRFLFSPNQKLIGIFIIFILMPGAFLGVFALRVLRQEEQLVKQRTRERMERVAKEIGNDLTSEFYRWEEIIRLAAGDGTLNADSFPDNIQEVLQRPGGGVLLSKSEDGLEIFPSSALLYAFGHLPTPRIRTSRLPAAVVWAESLEIERKDYTRAILAYRNLLESGGPELRPLLLQRLARTLRKADRLDEATSIYRDLQQMDTSWIGGLPSDLIAQFELCSLAADRNNIEDLAARALALYGELTGGKWILDKPRYSFYSDRCRSWCQESPVAAGEFDQLRKTEESKLALSRAVEKLLNEPKKVLSSETGIHLAFWQSDPFAAVVLSENLLGAHWWPRILSTQGEDVDAVLYTADGHALFGSPPIETPPFALMHDVAIDGMPWRIQVWPWEPVIIYADIRQRQNLSIAILAFVAVFLLFGSYFTVRIVRRELEVARMRADFVSTVSHEFRSPLTGIRQLGEMLLDGRATEKMKQREYFKMIVQESNRLTRLVENILDFSRMEEGRKEFRFETLNTSRWLQKLVSDFKTGIVTDGVTVETDIPEGLPPISADSEALGSAVHNLLDNAVKYSPGAKTVWLDVEFAGGEVRIVVRDKGVGISESDQKHIFDRFYRTDSEISIRIKGAGLGLSLVRHIVRAHGGKVEFESQEGEGSTFSIRIPAPSVTDGG
jgi:signal transduction histidine kinase